MVKFRAVLVAAAFAGVLGCTPGGVVDQNDFKGIAAAVMATSSTIKPVTPTPPVPPHVIVPAAQPDHTQTDQTDWHRQYEELTEQNMRLLAELEELKNQKPIQPAVRTAQPNYQQPAYAQRGNSYQPYYQQPVASDKPRFRNGRR